MVSRSPTAVDVQTITLGNGLAITPADTLQLAIIGVVTMTTVLLRLRDLMAVFSDEGHAPAIGLRPDMLGVVFLTPLAAATVAARQTVGAFLVIATVATPGAAA